MYDTVVRMISLVGIVLTLISGAVGYLILKSLAVFFESKACQLEYYQKMLSLNAAPKDNKERVVNESSHNNSISKSLGWDNQPIHKNPISKSLDWDDQSTL